MPQYTVIGARVEGEAHPTAAIEGHQEPVRMWVDDKAQRWWWHGEAPDPLTAEDIATEHMRKLDAEDEL